MGQRRILFVDDEQRVLDSLRRELRDLPLDAELIFVNSVDGALSHVEAGVDVIVSDVRMPDKDGFALLQAVVNDDRMRGTPVIMLTGHGDDALKQQALDQGATDLLTKPVAKADLIARLRNALRARADVDTIREQAAALTASRLDVIWCLARAAEQRDGVTGRHVVRVAAYSKVLAEELHLVSTAVELIGLAAPLHDVGKIGIPDAVLRKRDRLSEAEWLIMKEHCRIGAEILTPDAAAEAHASSRTVAEPEALAQGELLTLASSIALTHHERWDGGGYPLGLAGEAIPIASRIVTIADVYDALRSTRPYKPPYDHETALRLMEPEVGGRFDPLAYSAFRAVSARIGALSFDLADSLDAIELDAA